jgi:hypothetical protein
VLEELCLLFIGHHTHFLQAQVGCRVLRLGEGVLTRLLFTGEVGVIQPLFLDLLIDPVAKVKKLCRRARGAVLTMSLD